MNGRIKQLATEVGISVDYLTNTKQIVLLEKFAELMVVEFTESVKQTATRIAQTGFNDGLSMEEVNNRVNSALFVLEVMRERFGVNE